MFMVSTTTNRPEYLDNFHQGSAEIHSRGPIVAPLPSFDDVTASLPFLLAHSLSSLMNGSTGNLSQYFFKITFMTFCFVSLTSFPFCREILPLLSCRPSHLLEHIPSSYYLQKCPRDFVSISLHVYSTSQ